MAQRVVVVLHLAQELGVLYHANPFILGCISLGDINRPIVTAVVYEAAFPVLVRLSEDALDTLA
jgi:hypothetical protein